LGAGLVGAGNVARWLYLPRLRRPYAPFRLKAVYDSDTEAARRAAEPLGAEVCASLEALTRRPDVEAVFVCTPVQFHREAVLAALAAGKHVLCEKPLGRSLEEARAMREAARHAGKMNMVDFSYRFRPDLHFVGQIIRSGMLGRIHHLWGSISQGQWFTEDGRPSRERTDAAPWKYGPEGSVVLDLVPHLLDLCRWWLGEIRQVQAWTQRASASAADGQAACGVSLHFETGVVAQLLASRLATGHREQMLLDVSGSQGALRLDQRTLKLWTADQPRWRTILMPAIGPDFLAAFHRSVIDGTESAPTFEDGVKNNEAIDGVLLSARSGAAVSLPLPETAR
jgi:predicted dehydrogenase